MKETLDSVKLELIGKTNETIDGAKKGRENMHDAFDGFSLNLLYDENDKNWVAHFVEFPTVSAFGETPEEAIKELKVDWEGVKQSYIKRNEQIPVAPSKKSYSGHFNIRIDKRLHRALAIEASRTNLSLNALIAQKLTRLSDLYSD